MHIEGYIRQSDGAWVLRETNNAGDTIDVAPVGCRLPVSEIHFKVSFTLLSPSSLA